MSKKSTAKVAEQPDLLGAQAQPARSKGAVARHEPKPKAQQVATQQVATVTQMPAPQNMLAIIANAVMDPRCDVTKMQALLDMQKQIEERDALKAFTADFIKLQSDLSTTTIRQDGKIEIRSKDAKGERTGKVQQATPYATFNNIMKFVKPLLVKHNFTLSFETEPTLDGSRILVRGILAHALAHQRTTAFPLPAETSGSKNNVQGWGSSMSYGKRYCTIALLNIVSHAAEDTDRDGHASPATKAKADAQSEATKPDVIDGNVVQDDGVELCTDEQVMRMRDAIEDCGAPLPKVLATYQIAKLAELPAERYRDVLAACADWKKKHAK